MGIIVQLLRLFALLLLAQAILSWIRVDSVPALAKVNVVLWKITNPVLNPVRKVVRPVNGVDFSGLLVMVTIYFILIPLLS